jgi:hypothetical protein
MNHLLESESYAVVVEIYKSMLYWIYRLRAYGCVAYAYNFNNNLSKLDNTALKGILVGYDNQSASYKIYLPTQRKIIRSGHVTFNEQQLYYMKQQVSEPVFVESAINSVNE